MTFLLNPYIYGGWMDIRQVTIIPTPSANYQVRIVLNSSNFDYSKTYSNGSDIRFIESATDSPSTQYFSHWIESWNASGNSIIWVKIPTSGTNTFYMVYNNSSADSVSSIDNTMETGMRFRYYDGMGFNTLVGGGTDTSVNYNWGSGNVTIAGVGADPDTVSIIWDGWINPSGSGSHTFFATSDDGERLYARTLSDSSGTNTTLIDAWVDRAPTENSAAYSITDGNPKYIEYQWYENGGGAVAQLGWTPPSTGVKVYPIPSTNMRSPKYSSTYLTPYTYLGGSVYPVSNVITSGISFYFDPAITSSYAGSGTSIYDLSGNANNGTLTNGVGYNSSNSGILTFDGVDDVVAVTKNSGVPTGNYTILTFIYVRSLPASNGDSILDCGSGTTYPMRFLVMPTGNFKIQHIAAFAGAGLTSSTVLSLNTWYCVAAVNSSNTGTLYLNGVSDGTGTLTQGYDTFNFAIGWKPVGNASSVTPFDGYIGATLVYNRALNSTEISDTFNIFKSRYGL